MAGVGRGEVRDADEGLFGGCGGVEAGGWCGEEGRPWHAEA